MPKQEQHIETKLSFEDPERGAWEAYLRLAGQTKLGSQVDASQHLPGHLPSYLPQ